ncbi:protachykinin-1 isoform X1 [Excalfactoria chinensis]|uniref:protachykinin-1 isoform X1 n=2 Tax=Excalfactoria chinensis TaxID=46218 RepID=UPI003B3AF10F
MRGEQRPAPAANGACPSVRLSVRPCVPAGLRVHVCVFVGDVKAAMRLPLAFTVLLLASAQALADEMAAPDDLSYWADWADGEQKEELPLPLEHFLQRMARRPRPQQFFGLMGKRDAGYGQISHKRHKTDSFVGLMGKRSLNSGSSERSTAQNYERRRK